MILSEPCLDDNTLVALVEWRLPPAERARAEAHLDTCEACRAVVSSTASLLASSGSQADPILAWKAGVATLPKGTLVGRYVVLESVGEGGSAVVYAAYDPELNRKIALKLLRPSGAAEAQWQSRLVREAKAMARLSHPNVTAVYDVGTFEGSVFLAMELVSGTTLKEWLLGEPHGWQQVLTHFIDAGQGLAAAHDAGLVHRDFKPENVLIGTDGRVRVTDFGLVWEGAGPGSQDLPAITGPRTLIGTPAYMAPEQSRGGAIDPKADQFSFCVALFEALYGERPFPSSNLAELLVAVEINEVRPVPKGSRVPRWVRRVLLRGLSYAPGDRFPSMSALLSALQPAARFTWTRAAAAAGILLLGVGAATAAYRLQQRPRLCEGAERHLDGLWDGPMREALLQSITASGVSHGAESGSHTAAALDGYRDQWVASHRSACEATRLRGEQSEEVLTLRMVCLEERRQELAAFVRLLSHAEPQVVVDAARTARQLSPVSACDDVKALTAEVRPPSDPKVRDLLPAVRQQLAEGRALLRIGQSRQGMKLATAAVEATGALHYPPLEAEALFLLSACQEAAGDAPGAELTLRRANLAAAAGHHDRLVAEIWTRLIIVLGVRQQKAEAARLAAEQAEAAIARFGDNAALIAELADARVGLYTAQSQLDEALAEGQRAVALAEQAFGHEDLAVARALVHLASVHRARGRPVDALAIEERTLALFTRVLGPDHPSVGDTLFNMGNALNDQGRSAEAEPFHRRALALYEGVYGREHVLVARALNGLGGTLRLLGHYDEALEHLRRGLQLRLKLLGPKHVDVAISLTSLAAALAEIDRRGDAIAAYQQALQIVEEKYGPNHPDVARRLGDRAAMLLEFGSFKEALADATRAVSILEASPVGGNLWMAGALACRGRAELGVGRARDAVASLERALALYQAASGSPIAVAKAQFALARALWDLGQRGHAFQLGAQARQSFEAGGPKVAPELREVIAWMARHRS